MYECRWVTVQVVELVLWTLELRLRAWAKFNTNTRVEASVLMSLEGLLLKCGIPPTPPLEVTQ